MLCRIDLIRFNIKDINFGIPASEATYQCFLIPQANIINPLTLYQINNAITPLLTKLKTLNVGSHEAANKILEERKRQLVDQLVNDCNLKVSHLKYGPDPDFNPDRIKFDMHRNRLYINSLYQDGHLTREQHEALNLLVDDKDIIGLSNAFRRLGLHKVPYPINSEDNDVCLSYPEDNDVFLTTENRLPIYSITFRDAEQKIKMFFLNKNIGDSFLLDYLHHKLEHPYACCKLMFNIALERGYSRYSRKLGFMTQVFQRLTPDERLNKILPSTNEFILEKLPSYSMLAVQLKH